MKHSYKLDYRFVDGTTRTVYISNQDADLRGIADNLLQTGYITHLDGNEALIVNLRNVTRIEIEETTDN